MHRTFGNLGMTISIHYRNQVMLGFKSLHLHKNKIWIPIRDEKRRDRVSSFVIRNTMTISNIILMFHYSHPKYQQCITEKGGLKMTVWKWSLQLPCLTSDLHLYTVLYILLSVGFFRQIKLQFDWDALECNKIACSKQLFKLFFVFHIEMPKWICGI
jgi:hypothetical protein